MIKIITIKEPKQILLADSKTDTIIGPVETINIYTNHIDGSLVANLTINVDGLETYESLKDMQKEYTRDIRLKKETVEKALKSVNDFKMKANLDDLNFPMATTTIKNFHPANSDELYAKEYVKCQEPKKTQTEINLENEINDLKQRNKSLEKEAVERGRLLMKATVQDFVDAPGPVLNNTIMIIIEKEGLTAADYEFHTLLGNVDKVVKDLGEYDLDNSMLFIRCNEDVYNEKLKPILVDIPHKLV